MTTSKSHFEQRLSKIHANSFRKNNKKMCIDCLKPISNKNKLSVKIVVALTFALNYQNSSFKILFSL